jgi:hypothetical protein
VGSSAWVTYYGVDAVDGGLGLTRVIQVPERLGFMITVTDQVRHSRNTSWTEQVESVFVSRLRTYGKRLVDGEGVSIQEITHWKYSAHDPTTQGYFVHGRVIDIAPTVD